MIASVASDLVYNCVPDLSYDFPLRHLFRSSEIPVHTQFYTRYVGPLFAKISPSVWRASLGDMGEDDPG